MKRFTFTAAKWALIALVSAGLALSGHPSIWAQDSGFDSLPMAEKYVLPESDEPQVDPDDPNAKAKPKGEAYRKAENQRRADQSAALEALKAGRVNDVEPYLKDFVFPLMTQVDDKVLSNLGKIREEFFKLVSATQGPARKSLIEQSCLPTLKSIAEGNYHPSCRLNAILVIGNFNDVDASTGIAPKPNGESLKYLLSVAEKADAPEVLRVGALTGLHRVAQIESVQRYVDQGDLDRIFQLALATAQNKGPGADKQSEEVTYWLKRRSAQILGLLKNKGQNNETANALIGILADDKSNEWLRLDALEALKVIGVDKANSEQLVDSLIAFVADALEEEAKGIREQIEEYVTISLMLDDKFIIDSKEFQAGVGGGRDAPAAGAGGLDGADEQSKPGTKAAERKEGFDLPNYALNTIRRKTKAYLYHFHRALSAEAITKDLGADDKDRIRKALRVIERALRDTDIGLVDLARKPDVKAPFEEELKTNTPSELMYERFMSASTELKALKRKPAEGGTN